MIGMGEFREAQPETTASEIAKYLKEKRWKRASNFRFSCNYLEVGRSEYNDGAILVVEINRCQTI